MTTTEASFQTTIEDAGPCRKRITITVPGDVIDSKLADQLGTLATTTQIPGFRKGRAPMSLIERRFGSAVRTETRNQIMAEGFSSALEEHSLKPVTEPEPVDPESIGELEEGKAFTYAVEVEVVPEFDIPDLAGIEVKRPVLDVTDEMIENEILRMRTQLGEINEIDGGFEEGDKFIGSGTVQKAGDEEPFFRHDEIDVIVPGDDDGGRGHVLGLMIDGLAGIVSGKKVGDEIVIETVGPEGHELEHVRGEKLEIRITIRQGYRITPSEISAVVERYGLESEDVLREQVKHGLEQRIAIEQQAHMREQVYKTLMDSADFDLPQKLTENQASRLLERQRLEWLYRGAPPEEVERRLAELRGEADAESSRRLKLQFLLHAMAEKFEIQVNETEVNHRLALMARERGVRPDKLRQELAQTGGLNQLAVQVRDHKAADRILEDAKITDVTPEEWEKLVAEAKGDGAQATTKKKTTKKKTKKKTAAK